MPEAHRNGGPLSLNLSVECALISSRVGSGLSIILRLSILNHKLVVDNSASLDKLLLDVRKYLL